MFKTTLKLTPAHPTVINAAKLGGTTPEHLQTLVNGFIKALQENRVLCVVRHVSKSGMTRHFSYIQSHKNGGFASYPSLWEGMGFKLSKDYDVIAGGCGMDMNFHTIYSLVHGFYNNGWISKKAFEKLSQMTPTVI